MSDDDDDLQPPMVSCTADEATVHLPHNRFQAWKGRDAFHKHFTVQVRLEKNGNVFVSTQETHVSTLESATITLEQLYTVIRELCTRKPAPIPPDEIGAAVAEDPTYGMP